MQKTLIPDSNLKYIFLERNYNGPFLRNISDFKIPRINTVHFGEDSLRFFGCKIWNLIPNEIKSVDNLTAFKRHIRNWSPNKCPCRLCKTYIHHLGYVTISQ